MYEKNLRFNKELAEGNGPCFSSLEISPRGNIEKSQWN